jgi:broad specificity phosphatase PhoE
VARLILVRHGETEFNRTDRFRGRIDVPLNDTGLWQAEMAARAIQERYRVSAIYSSPLSRAMRTAEAVAFATGLSVQPLPGLLEFSYGDWDGKSYDDVASEYPEQYRLYLTQPQRARIPGGESIGTFRRRVAAAVEQAVSNHPEETVVLVGHRLVCRMMVCYLLSLDSAKLPRLEVDNASISVFEKREPEGWVALLLNDTCHLAGNGGQGPGVRADG